MQAVRRFAAREPGQVTDAAIAVAAAVLIAVAAWVPSLHGVTIAGPLWLRLLLPLLMGAALALRRRAPLLMWTGIWAGIGLQDLTTHHAPQSLAFVFVLFAGSYALGAHATVRRAGAALAITAPIMALIVLLTGAGPDISDIPLLAFWLAGIFVRARRQSIALAEHNAALQRQAEQAAEAERARIARELHDIVAHHLSVIVLQAAGARASGKASEAALEKIERSGRQALTETRRLLDVLHDTEETGL